MDRSEKGMQRDGASCPRTNVGMSECEAAYSGDIAFIV